MPRIPGVAQKEASILVRLMYRMSRRRYGVVMEPASVAAHHDGVLAAWGSAELVAEKGLRTLPASLRDLVSYRVATPVGCSWCVDFGTMLQKLAGMDIDRLRQLNGYRDSTHFTELEKLAIDYADAMTAQPPTVTDQQVSELDSALGHKGLVELTFVIALENLRARCFSALGITDQGFTSGEACQIPA
ncbi:MAG: carboxymuconolactone decarboxylase family protein [Sciscionella sp.]